MVTSQTSQPVCRCLPTTGLRIGRHLLLQQRNKPDINPELFVDYIRRVLLPYLSNLRQCPELTGEEAVLWIDNCPPHVPQEGLDLLTQARVRVRTYTPHTTNIFQIFDLTLFGELKHHGQAHRLLGTENRTADFIFRVDQEFQDSTSLKNRRMLRKHGTISKIVDQIHVICKAQIGPSNPTKAGDPCSNAISIFEETVTCLLSKFR
jgi:hypothetical protein